MAHTEELMAEATRVTGAEIRLAPCLFCFDCRKVVSGGMEDGASDCQHHELSHLLVTQVKRIVGGRHFGCFFDIAAMFSRAICYAALQVESCLPSKFGPTRMNSCSPGKGTTSKTEPLEKDGHHLPPSTAV